ncbi:hypothetical protein KR054_002640 [Drosophila jambulina]|nr:hypothetical protein KR054_002640 [Drosophila jambulina]
MSGDMPATPQSGRRPRLGLGRRTCHSTPLLRLQGEESSVKTLKDDRIDTPRTFSLSLSARRIGLSKNRKELTKKKLEFAAVQEVKDMEPSISQETSKKKEPKKKKERREECNKPEDEKGKEIEKDLPKKQELDAPQKQKQDPNNKQQKQEPLKNLEPPKSNKILELQGDIEIWRKGFIASIDDLQTMAEPRLTKRELLTQLGIPLEMLRYLEEE